jgi:hypothetical protein
MSWNYRIIRSVVEADEVTYALHECYYGNNGDAIPTWTSEPANVLAETRAGLLWVLSVMTEALARPVFEVKDGKLVEVEPAQQLSDDIRKAISNNKKYAEGMV